MEGGDNCADLPPGFRFHPTDEEIITHYLVEKVKDRNYICRAIGDVDLNRCEPWDLPSKAKMGEKEWFFFCQRDRKYPTGMRTNRATESGYWKATGKDKEIYKGRGALVGMKKTLVFYRGRAPKGEKTNWVMHEFRLDRNASTYFNLPRTAKDEWVVCRVIHKNNTGIKRSPITGYDSVSSFVNELLDSQSSLPPLSDNNNNNNSNTFNFNDYNNNANNSEFELDFKNLSDLFQIPYYPSMDLPNLKPAALHPQFHMPNPPLPITTFPSSSNALIYHSQAATVLRGPCKVEQYSNHSLVSASQDTGLSTDRNVTAEISSVLSKHEIGSCDRSYEDIEGPSSSSGPVENMWRRY
ncbi:hypothetical protein QJS10_CPB04g00649 [Acorus calamus]|uniref:NAC domain-containing protein n=1 Tax=Acorus calamus TaxID=4465 RepID=A0AAV9F0X7_ACOCL|nr:hypothetical protein QJS10_CPB04g00649 [Acorus calamus]